MALNRIGLIWQRLASACSLGSLVMLCACAGPTSPFGAIHSAPKKVVKNEINRDPSNAVPVKINFFPSRQNLHQKQNLIIEVTDPIGLEPMDSVRVFFNDTDITASFFYLANSKVDSTGTKLSIEFKNLGLRADQRNKISVKYKNQLGLTKTAEYLTPECPLNQNWSINNIMPFNPPDRLINYINKQAQKGGVNPSAMISLIAKESGFRSRAVSWAKALGLTQITPLAEVEVAEKHENFPRYPGINQMSFLQLKAKIMSGEINSKTEWRLNPRHSVEGGVTFLNRLIKYWSRPEQIDLLSRSFEDPIGEFDRVVLASYNSGQTRVKRSIQKYGDQYLWKPNHLRAAREYVQKIQSYCYHFTHTDDGGML